MAKKKISTAALKRLEAKGIKLNVVKKAEKPAANLNQPIAAPKQKKQTAGTPKVTDKKLRQWELEVDTRDFQGFIKTVTITEI